MATIREAEPAALLAFHGYRQHGTVVGTELSVLSDFPDDHILLVRGASVAGGESRFEYTVMSRTDTLYFKDRQLADRFVEAVVSAGHQAEVEIDLDSDYDDPYRFCVRYTGPEVTDFSIQPYAALGRKASRFCRVE